MGLSILFSKDNAELSNKLVDKIAEISKNYEKFSVAISGGSLPITLSKLGERSDVDFSKWWIFFADERKVPLDHPDSNYLNAKNSFLDKCTIPKQQIFPIKYDTDLEKCAADYNLKLSTFFMHELPNPSFDLILLGIGPDGHVCSLFPKHNIQGLTGLVAPIYNSPKPPPERITLTLNVLKHAKNTIFVCSGDGKADIVKQVLVDKNMDLPATLAQSNNDTYWFLDSSGSLLPSYPYRA